MKKQKMSDKILVEATKLFAANGISNTSLESIAVAVGVRKQTLLHYFKSKELLRQAVLASIFIYWKDTVPRALIEARGATNRLEAALNVVIEFFLADRNRARLVIRETLDHPLEIEEQIREFFYPWLGLITEYIERGQEEGLIHHTVDPEAYIVQIIIGIISCIATGEIFIGAFPNFQTHEQLRERLLSELKAMAKRSLFLN